MVELALAFATCYGALAPGAAMAFAGDAPFALAVAWALLAIGVELPRSKAAPHVALAARGDRRLVSRDAVCSRDARRGNATAQARRCASPRSPWRPCSSG